jgi:hypothetical protein
MKLDNMTRWVAAFNSFPFAAIFVTVPRRQPIVIIFKALFELEECLSFFLNACDLRITQIESEPTVIAVHRRSPNRSRNSA